MKIQFTDAELIRALFIGYETLLESEENQILGFVHVICSQGALVSKISSFHNPVDVLRLFKWGEQSLPMRHKAIHMVSIAKIFKYIVDAVRSCLSKKINDRFYVRKLFH